MTFWKEHRLNSIFWSCSIWIMIKYTTLVCPGAGAGSRSRNFSIPAPAPAKSSGSFRLRLHNTACNNILILVTGQNIVLHKANFVYRMNKATVQVWSL
jgi:hypothetical protein